MSVYDQPSDPAKRRSAALTDEIAQLKLLIARVETTTPA